MGKILRLPIKQDSNQALDKALEIWSKTPEGQTKIKTANKIHWKSLTFMGKLKDLWLRLLYRSTN